MEWSDIKDPTGRFVFDISNSIAQSSYWPEDIQKLIDEEGVEQMVREVNARFTQKQKRTAFKLGRINGKDAVVASVI